MFDFSKNKEIQVFRSTKEAYSYLFIKLQSEGIDIEKASERAFKFSTEYAERMDLPTKTEVKEKGVKGFLQNFKLISDFVKENPTMWEVGKPIVLGAISAIGGAAAGAGLSSAIQDPEPLPVAPIIYDEETEINTN